MKPTRFVHIPKTAGLTLRQVILRQNRGAPFFDFSGNTADDIQRYLKLPEQERQAIRLFLGHAPITTGIEAADTATMITLLRDPISRVKSLCQHVSEGKWEDYPRETFDLDRFLNSGDNQLSNHQTKILINSGSGASPYLINSISPAEARDRALENLFHKVSRFGIQEYFDESLIVFGQLLQWGMPFYLSVNKKDARRTLEFKQSHLDCIAELNAIDMEVYAAAKKKFHEIVAGPDFDAAKLKRFQALNRRVAPLLKLRSSVGRLLRRR